MIKKCQGCGITLQNTNPKENGYVEDLNKDVCERCFKLKYYGKYQNVTLQNKDFQKIIDSIPKDSLVVYLTSVLDLKLDYLSLFPNVIIAITKRDLLPKSVKDSKLKKYISSVATNYLDIEVISTIKNYNIQSLLSKIEKYLPKSREVYFIGMTSSGKSTLLNKIVKDLKDEDSKITTSLYPSTTLDQIKIDMGTFQIIDTPGLLKEVTILNSLSSEEIKKITPKKEIKPRSYQLKGKGSLFIEDYLRIDYYTSNNIVIYIANNIKIINTIGHTQRLKDASKYHFNIENKKDLVIEDFCFISFSNSCQIDIYTPLTLGVYTRDKLI